MADSDPLAHLGLAEPEARARFALIYRTVLAESAAIRRPQFEAIEVTDLARLFVLYDRHFFDGLLGRLIERAHVPPVRFRLSGRMTRAAGKTTASLTRTRAGFQVVRRVQYEIAVSTFLLFQAFRDDLIPGSAARPVLVTGLVCSDRLEALLRIFEHELLHLAEFLAYGRSSCSAAPFRRLSRAIFGHEASVHALITPVELAATVHSIGRGDRVAFGHAGVDRVGVVNRITKRATVLVPDPGGRLYSDGGRYAAYLVPLDRLRKL